MADTRADALSVGGKIELREVKRTIGKKVCLLGNISGIETLQLSTAEKVQQETERIMTAGKENGGFILNSEEGNPDETQQENVEIMMKNAKKLSYYE